MLNKILRKAFVFVLCFASFIFVGCGPNNANNNNLNENIENISEQSSIVVYFSRTNNTEKIANYIIEITKSNKYEIEAAVPYTDEDINYNNSNSRANQEQHNPNARPEIGGNTIDLSNYDIIYLGYPIWWGQAPKIMYTFVESYNLTGKTIIPFCTSASSGIGSSAPNLASASFGATWLEGRRFSASDTKTDVMTWLNSLSLGGKENV